MNFVKIPIECPNGELNLVTKDKVRAAIADAAVGADVTVLDLSEVQYIDSSGLSMLLLFSKSRDGRVYMFGANGQVGEILESTGLGNVLKIYDTEKEATAAGIGAYERIFGRI